RAAPAGLQSWVKGLGGGKMRRLFVAGALLVFGLALWAPGQAHANCEPSQPDCMGGGNSSSGTPSNSSGQQSNSQQSSSGEVPTPRAAPDPGPAPPPVARVAPRRLPGNPSSGESFTPAVSGEAFLP